jgi:hypothetical protein
MSDYRPIIAVIAIVIVSLAMIALIFTCARRDEPAARAR